jgi:F0F1-type ATP synthase assembly protein I
VLCPVPLYRVILSKIEVRVLLLFLNWFCDPYLNLNPYFMSNLILYGAIKMMVEAARSSERSTHKRNITQRNKTEDRRL